MLENWLKPLPAKMVREIAASREDCLGNQALVHQKGQLPDLKQVKVALLGVGDAASNAVREQLYALGSLGPGNAVADLGNLKKLDEAQLIPVLHELLDGGVLPVVVSAPSNLARAQFLAYQDFKNLINLAVVHERFEPGEEGWAALMGPRHPLLFHASMIGLQSHFMSARQFKAFDERQDEVIRLGKARSRIEDTEPVIRDADVMMFHLNALRLTEAPAVEAPTPSGFFTEEACQLCRYAGLSDKQTSFGIYGYVPENDLHAQTASVAAQMVWYFLEGYFNRKKDFPVSKRGLTEYIVEFPGLHYQLTFWKSNKSGRWWMQVPVASKKKLQRHALVPCSYNDYQAACREELPDRLMLALQRFG
jgi:formiminoglutamase